MIVSASSVPDFSDDVSAMQHALRLARQGLGRVEPNPPVGAVIVTAQRQLIAEGWHQQFGGPHAEIHAIQAAAGNTRGHDLFVTLEPCSHHGKTPPCADAVIAAGFRRVVIGCADPAPHVAGQGIDLLQAAGITTLINVCQQDAEALIAPFRKLMLTQLPWVHAKWAMTLDGRIATRTGHSQWISSAASRAEVHLLRGRMDAIITGAGTVRADNPELTARPPGPRTPLRVVMDDDGLSVTREGRLMNTLSLAPVLLCVSEQYAASDHVQELLDLGAQVFAVTGDDRGQHIQQLLQELGRQKFNHVLLEAGTGLMGSFFDQQLVDEVHVFVAPKIVGGTGAMSPIGGTGLAQVATHAALQQVHLRRLEDDVLLEGHLCHNSPDSADQQ